MTYTEAIQFLYDLQWFGLKLGLENTRRLAALAGDPQERLRFIHVAGTNGKGSTCAMLESIYRAAGLRVGLFTSPHLVSFGERIQVNRCPLGEDEVVALVEETRALLRHFPVDHSPTFFEAVTVMALRHFVERECELVVWETGMGGRLDATNIVAPLACVITNVQFDHQQWLGDTLAKIATEKAGIIKSGVPVLTACDEPEAVNVIRDTARNARTSLTEVTPADAAVPPLDTVRLPLLGDHQRLNAALAVATVQVLREKVPVDSSAVVAGLERVDWPGRLQLIEQAPGKLSLVDGAHNPGGMATLRAALERQFSAAAPAMIIGVLRDKDWPAMCRVIAPLARDIYFVPVASSRTATPQDLRAECVRIVPGVRAHVCGSLEEALQWTANEPFRVITGSLYLAGQALERLGALAPRPQNERRLNEWRQTLPVTGVWK